MTGCTKDAVERVEEQQLRERLRTIEPVCDTDYTPDGFDVNEGQAIALTVGKRPVSCDLVETEPMDNETWAVHIDARKPDGCEFSAVIDGTTGEVSNRFRDCPPQVGFITQAGIGDPHDALVGGRLVFRDNCFYVDRVLGARDAFALAVWPHGFSYRGDEQSARILDRRGAVVARVGDHLVGGGMVTDDDQLVAADTKGCHGPYWLMGPTVERKPSRR